MANAVAWSGSLIASFRLLRSEAQKACHHHPRDGRLHDLQAPAELAYDQDKAFYLAPAFALASELRSHGVGQFVEEDRVGFAATFAHR